MINSVRIQLCCMLDLSLWGKGLKTSLNVDNLFIPSHLSGEQLLQKFPLAPLAVGHSQPHGIINLSSMLWIRTGVCFQRDVPEIPFVQEASPAAFLWWGSAAAFPSFKPIFGRTQLIIGPLWGSFGSVVLEIAESWSEFGCILNTQVTKAVLYSLLGIAWLWVLTAGVLVWSHSPLCHPSTRSLFFSAIVSLTQRLDAQKKEKHRPCARAFLCCSLKAHYLKVFISVQPFIQTQTF